MEKLSGLVLDVNDDHEGEVFKSIFPTLDTVPEIVKCAYKIGPEERSELPDDSFAVVLHDDGMTLRKYACVDEGNTALSVEYFLKLGHKLPAEAQHRTAQNLCEACAWFGFDPPEQLQKVAFGLNTALSAVNLAIAGPEIAQEASGQIKKNMQVAKASQGAVNPAIAQPLKPVGQ